MRRKVWLIILTAAATAQGANPVAVGTRRELFVDHYLIEKLDGAQLALGCPHDEGPVVKFDKPWEGQFSGYCTAIFDGTIYRLYYRGHPGGGKEAFRTEVTCYAESRDGRTWVKPELGSVEWNGSKANNIILPPGEKYHWATHNFTPFLDTRPGIPAAERFKALGGVQQSGGLHALTSRDGIHWSRLRPEPVFNVSATPDAPKPYGLDSQNVAFWSEGDGKYVCYIRKWMFDEKNKGLRRIARITSQDFVTWSAPEWMEYRDATGRPAPIEDLYTNQTHPYFRAPHIDVAISARFMAGRQVLTAEQAKALGVNPGYFRDTSDGVFMTTRGGTVYDRTFPEGFIRPGIGLNNWVSRTNYPALNVVPTGPAEMSIFANQDYAQPTAHLRRYSLRLDGFASLHAGAAGGSMMTKPLTFSGHRLVLNFATSAAGEVRVGLCDAAGKPIPGFDMAACRPLIGNEIEREISWTEGPDLARYVGQPVRLVFRLKDADVFSFRFVGDPK
jgi:hypothetical protein